MDIIVLAIEQVDKKRVRVHFDNGITCLLYHGELKAFQLKENVCLSEEIYNQLISDVLTKSAKKRAMYLLKQMDCTEEQLRQKLLRNEYPMECIDEAIAYVKRFHYLDDYRYACNFIIHFQEKMSRKQLVLKLLQKGVKKECIEHAMEEEYYTDDIPKITQLLEKRKYDSDFADYKEVQRTYQFLLRKGYRSSDILKAMNCKDCTIYCGQ